MEALKPPTYLSSQFPDVHTVSQVNTWNARSCTYAKSPELKFPSRRIHFPRLPAEKKPRPPYRPRPYPPRTDPPTSSSPARDILMLYSDRRGGSSNRQGSHCLILLPPSAPPPRLAASCTDSPSFSLGFLPLHARRDVERPSVAAAAARPGASTELAAKKETAGCAEQMRLALSTLKPHPPPQTSLR